MILTCQILRILREATHQCHLLGWWHLMKAPEAQGTNDDFRREQQPDNLVFFALPEHLMYACHLFCFDHVVYGF